MSSGRDLVAYLESAEYIKDKESAVQNFSHMHFFTNLQSEALQYKLDRDSSIYNKINVRETGKAPCQFLDDELLDACEQINSKRENLTWSPISSHPEEGLKESDSILNEIEMQQLNRSPPSDGKPSLMGIFALVEVDLKDIPKPTTSQGATTSKWRLCGCNII